MNLTYDTPEDIVEQRRPYVVFLRGRWDDHERQSIRLLAYGEHDARHLAEDIHPGFIAVKVENAA